MAEKLSNKKIGLLFFLGAGVAATVSLFVFLNQQGNKAQPEQRKVNIVSDIPKAEVEALPDSKTEAYRKKKSSSSIEDYWDNIAGDRPEEEDPYAELSGEKKRSTGTSGIKEVTYEELFGTNASATAQAQPSMEDRRNERARQNAQAMAQMNKDQMEALTAIMQMQAQANRQGEDGQSSVQDAPAQTERIVPERDNIDIEQVKIVRSGGISSLDDEFGGISSSGISSLDGEEREFAADEAYPFKCMFVRQEKLKSSQRVSVRLLEDIVVEGQLVRKNTHLNAICTIGDRIDLKVSNIDINGRILNLDFDAYDNDGTRGIYAPDLEDETQLEDALKNVAINAGRRRMSSAVGQTVQDLLSAGSMVITGKGKDRTVTIPAGYQFYLVRHKTRR